LFASVIHFVSSAAAATMYSNLLLCHRGGKINNLEFWQLSIPLQQMRSSLEPAAARHGTEHFSLGA
jgi:hypothetical protein